MSPTRSGRNTNAALLIQSIVRQTVILLTQLASTVEGQPPLARITAQVFSDLAQELERLGLSRKVSADMFGLSLSTHERKHQRIDSTAGSAELLLRQKGFSPPRTAELLVRGDIHSDLDRIDDFVVRAVDAEAPILVDAAGEGTYAVAVWQGHPLEHEALDILRQLHQMLTELRTRVAEVNEAPPLQTRSVAAG